MAEQRLKNQALALVQLKGGVGKTILSVNLAAISALQNNWTTVLVDLDANAPLTGAVFGGYKTSGTVITALERVSSHEQIDDLLVFAPGLGVYILQGDIRGLPTSYYQYLPLLIKELKENFIDTPQGFRPVDFILVDPPGENRELNAAVLSAVDAVAMPIMVSSPDIAASTITLQMISHIQKQQGCKPRFFGLIPNRVARKGYVEKAFLDAILSSGKLLPFIPASEAMRSTLIRKSRQGGEAVVQFSPRSKLSARLICLWEAMNASADDSTAYVEEFRQYITGNNQVHVDKAEVNG